MKSIPQERKYSAGVAKAWLRRARVKASLMSMAAHVATSAQRKLGRPTPAKTAMAMMGVNPGGCGNKRVKEANKTEANTTQDALRLRIDMMVF